MLTRGLHQVRRAVGTEIEVLICILAKVSAKGETFGILVSAVSGYTLGQGSDGGPYLVSAFRNFHTPFAFLLMTPAALRARSTARFSRLSSRSFFAFRSRAGFSRRI